MESVLDDLVSRRFNSDLKSCTVSFYYNQHPNQSDTPRHISPVGKTSESQMQGFSSTIQDDKN
jgi:hypothetical protein